ncbi:MAG: T9SS type A sorting domain-containing protein [Chitinophagales bacterium]|nr:T9SS type A sorting domain-containing protein [Chitinophagales bacterium]
MKSNLLFFLSVFTLSFSNIDASAQKADKLNEASDQLKLDLSHGSVRVYPNPSNGPIELTFHSKVSGKYGITIFDDAGNGLLSIDGIASEGTNHISLNLSGYGPGRYPISVTGEGIVAKVLVIIK